MNWALFALGISLGAWALVAAAARRYGASRAAVLAAIPLLVVASLNAAAPVRGLVDPSYVGYSFGLLHAGIGREVTAVAGSVFLVALASAWLAVTREGRPLWLVAASSAAFAAIVGIPWLEAARADPAANMIQFGEYLTIPGLPATFLLLAVLVLPLALVAFWAASAAVRGPRRAGG